MADNLQYRTAKQDPSARVALYAAGVRHHCPSSANTGTNHRLVRILPPFAYPLTPPNARSSYACPVVTAVMMSNADTTVSSRRYSCAYLTCLPANIGDLP